MVILYSLLFIIIIVGSLGILYVYQYNKLQHSKTKIDQAECLIDEALRNKYDIICSADTLVKEELDSKKSLFGELDKLKKDNISNFDLDRKLQEYENIMIKIKDDYPDLADKKVFKEILNNNKRASEKLQAAKSYYNKYTSELNDLVRTFPSNIVAKMHSIEIKPFFDGKNMQDAIIDDFKL